MGKGSSRNDERIFVAKLFHDTEPGVTHYLTDDAVNFIKIHAVTCYNDNERLVAVMRECVVIASYEDHPLLGTPCVVLDELLMTYPSHLRLYSRE